MAVFLSVRRLALKHWDTCLLTVSGILFLWQVMAYFLPTTQVLPSLPSGTAPAAAVFLAHQPKTSGQANALEALSAEKSAEVLKGSNAETNQKRYPAKKSKPKLMPASIHLNSVSLAQLDSLPGVGPKLAKRIIDYRQQHGPFQTIEDLKNVRGIGDKNFAKMRRYLAL